MEKVYVRKAMSKKTGKRTKMQICSIPTRVQRRNKTNNTIPSNRRLEYSYVRISIATTKGIKKIIICPSNNTALVRE